MLSLIIPIFKNELNIPPLIIALNSLYIDCKKNLDAELEVVFVIDGSPDKSYELLKNCLNKQVFPSQLLLLSRNFGAFAAVRAGLAASKGDYCSVMAADLQEPPELVLQFFTTLISKDYDVAVGYRLNRSDPLFSRIFSTIFWRLYKSLVIKDLPYNGVDVFACNRAFKQALLKLEESHTSLIGLIYWLGFRRIEIPYSRKQREIGISSWSLQKKIKYMLDSLFAFTDLPIKFLLFLGTLGVTTSIIFGLVVLFGKIFGDIQIPGYTATILTVMFFGGINTLGIGIIGNYTWRAYENTKIRPSAVVFSHEIINNK